MKKLLFILIYSIFLSANAQVLEGYIIDSTTQEKLPYANITLTQKNKGCTTNTSGYFTMTIDTNSEVNDSLLISFIGYTSKTIALSTALQNTPITIALTPDNQTLEEVVITDKKLHYGTTKVMGIHTKKATFPTSVPFGYEVATFIKNEQQLPGHITGINLKLKYRKESEYTTYPAFFRLAFYEVNASGFPGKYLSTANIIIQPDGSKNVQINLEDYHIPLPKKGVFVAVETINAAEEAPENSMYVTSPNLLFTHTKTPLFYKRYRGKKWTKKKSASVFKKNQYQIPYMKIKVQYQK
ncbi:carboxypeptidase-like regulatory domain-containing protein [Neptunitalea lumnitzerae]|uniref:Membrane protein n=1 Tax=Neptunitalea lumnitzerae TaxID=2965509 RepID=A0ABQ5MF14_9FLAO|nr:carboxypeptidase-like regulatory domain-containing protein [Neptunitalea sp. Y10]GLB47984.1 membrane protein [Neptunitalea sp. Y10]